MGQVGLNTDKYPANATQEMLGFIDNRCTPCESTNGTFKDLQTQAIQVLGLTPASAETFVANNRTKTAFNSALSNALKSNVTIKPI